MDRGSTRLDNPEYDSWLASQARRGGRNGIGAERELRKRNAEKKNANKGYEGWHFGIDERPVFTKDKNEFKRELDKRGLMMKDDVRNTLK